MRKCSIPGLDGIYSHAIPNRRRKPRETLRGSSPATYTTNDDMMNKLLTISMLLACISAHAKDSGAEPRPYSPQYYACLDKAGPTTFYDQTADSNCDAEEVKVQKKRINAAYGKLVKLWKSNPQEIAKLNAAQKAWVQWRDSTYELLQEAGGTNGQVVYLVSSNFLLRSLVDQANLLETIVASNGG